MIDLPPLPVPIEDMFFFTSRRGAAVEAIGAYSDPSSAGITYLVVGPTLTIAQHLPFLTKSFTSRP